MRLKIIRQLVNVNIIYASQPAQIAKLRAKQAKKPDVKLNVARKSVLNYLFLGLVYFVIFGLLFSIYDFVNQPAFFVNMVALFSLMTISQGFMSFYNVFYESKDLQFYRPYAFSDAEVIAGKSISVILTFSWLSFPWSAISDPACPSRRLQSVRDPVRPLLCLNSLRRSLFSDDHPIPSDH